MRPWWAERAMAWMLLAVIVMITVVGTVAVVSDVW
jgi:hypothetical protein